MDRGPETVDQVNVQELTLAPISLEEFLIILFCNSRFNLPIVEIRGKGLDWRVLHVI